MLDKKLRDFGIEALVNLLCLKLNRVLLCLFPLSRLATIFSSHFYVSLCFVGTRAQPVTGSAYSGRVAIPWEHLLESSISRRFLLEPFGLNPFPFEDTRFKHKTGFELVVSEDCLEETLTSYSLLMRSRQSFAFQGLEAMESDTAQNWLRLLW